jgi:hypothetical protein
MFCLQGIRCVRRDTVEFTRSNQAAIVEHICHNRIEEATKLGRTCVTDLFAGTVPFDELVTSRKVSARYKVVATCNDGSKLKVSCTPYGKWEAVEGKASGTCVIVPGESWKMLAADGSAFGVLTLSQPSVHVLHKMEQRTPGSGPKTGKA